MKIISLQTDNEQLIQQAAQLLVNAIPRTLARGMAHT